jgi:hypothetical protein
MPPVWIERVKGGGFTVNDEQYSKCSPQMSSTHMEPAYTGDLVLVQEQTAQVLQADDRGRNGPYVKPYVFQGQQSRAQSYHKGCWSAGQRTLLCRSRHTVFRTTCSVVRH